MKITIVQKEAPAAPLSNMPDADVTVEFDSGEGLTFKCQTRSVMDPNGQESNDLAHVGYFARENGTFTITFDYVRGVSFKHLEREEDHG
jgi:hypothetical protein